MVEEKRNELGVPGMAVVIVMGGEVIYTRGFGLRDVEHNKSVTPDTLFRIGSDTKAFTAMATVMSQDDGKLSLEDSPKKYLPYFKLQDPEANLKVTVRDLLCHYGPTYSFLVRVLASTRFTALFIWVNSHRDHREHGGFSNILCALRRPLWLKLFMHLKTAVVLDITAFST